MEREVATTVAVYSRRASECSFVVHGDETGVSMTKRPRAMTNRKSTRSRESLIPFVYECAVGVIRGELIWDNDDCVCREDDTFAPLHFDNDL